ARVATYQAKARHGVVWVTLGSGATDIPAFELMDDPGHNVLMSGPYHVKASGPRVIENFLDVGHFPFVHEGILGDRSRPEMVDYQDRIFAQDRPILESQRPELLPLDLQAELHLRSDRTAIAYRRWLRELGVRTGAY